MSPASQRILDAFQQLSAPERHEVASVILRSVTDSEYPPLDDEALAQIADESFQAYDAEEACRNEDQPG